MLLAWTNYSAGTSASVLEDVTTSLPHMEAKWLVSMRDYLIHARAWIEVDEDGSVPLEREHDDHIMDIILQLKEFKPAQIRMLNYCRMYLGAVTLSDLTTANGIYLDNAKLHGHISRMSSTTRWLQIHQDRPAEAQWILWRKANLLWSSKKGRLKHPLGRWLRNNDDRRIAWPSYAHGPTLALKVHDSFQLFAMDAHGRQVGNHTASGIRYEDLHPSANPVEVNEAPDGQWTMRAPTTVVDPDRAPAFGSFYTYLQMLRPWEADLLQHVKLELDQAYLCFDLQLYFYAGTDGSVKLETMEAFGWMLSNLEGDRVASAMGPAQGAMMDLYRVKCTGMLLLLRFLFRICVYTHMDDPWRGLIGTDRQSMLDRLYTVDLTTTTATQLASLDVLDPEWDFISGNPGVTA